MNLDANMTALYPGDVKIQVYHHSADPHAGPGERILHDATPTAAALLFAPAPDHGHGMSPGAGDLIPDRPSSGVWARLQAAMRR